MPRSARLAVVLGGLVLGWASCGNNVVSSTKGTGGRAATGGATGHGGPTGSTGGAAAGGTTGGLGNGGLPPGGDCTLNEPCDCGEPVPCWGCACTQVADSNPSCGPFEEPDGTLCSDADASIGNGVCSGGVCVGSDDGGAGGSGGATGTGGTPGTGTGGSIIDGG